MNDTPLFNAAVCDGIATGTCVMISDDQIVYAGPIKSAPNAADMTVLLNPIDFEKLKTVIDRKRH